MNGTLKAAQTCVEHGLSCLPITPDDPGNPDPKKRLGNKTPYWKLLPVVKENGKNHYVWGPLQERLPTDKEVERMFSNGAWFGIIAGKVSGNLELIDFDVPGKHEPGFVPREAPAYKPFCDLVTEHGYGELLDSLGMATTPSGGIHLLYRCEEEVESALKLASTMIGTKKEVLIETRGEGGYFATFPTPGYKIVRGLYKKIPVISKVDRDFLLACARSFEEVYEQPVEPWQSQPRRGTQKRPGDLYNEQGDLTYLLIKHGWQQFGKSTHGRSTWVRPGKQRKDGPSATYDPNKGLYVFSSNASPFESGRGYSKFQVFTTLEHQGDFIAAAQWLSKNGYSSYEQAQSRTKSSAQVYQEDAREQAEKRPRFVRMSEIEEKPIEWIWRPYMAKGALCLLAGDPGVGKGMLIKAIACAFSNGIAAPGMEAIEPSNVLLCCPEDDNERVTKPLLRKMGADMQRIITLDGKAILDEEFASELEECVAENDIKFLALDPIVAFTDSELNLSRANEVRGLLNRIITIIERSNIMGVVSAHLSKAETTKAIYKVSNSIDFIAACRSVLLCGQDPDDKDKRSADHIKSNWGPIGKPIGYSILEHPATQEAVFTWTGESDLSANRMSQAPTVKVDMSKAVAEAAVWLQEYLSNGPRGAKEVVSDSKDAGIAYATLKRAKGQLEVKSERNGSGRYGDGDWAWVLPTAEPETYWNKEPEPYEPFNDTF